MRKLFFPLFILPFLVSSLFAQDSLYFRQNIKILSSPDFHGRGYAFKGDSIAADFIANEFKKLNLKKWSPDYFQYFNINMNVFEGDTLIHFGDKFPNPQLFENTQIMAYSAAIHGAFKVKKIKINNLCQQKIKISADYQNQFILIDISDLDTKDSIQKKKYDKALEIVHSNLLNAKGYILVSKSLLGWPLSYGKIDAKHVTVNVTKAYLKKTPKIIFLNLYRQHKNNYQTQNVCGYIEGKTHPDSFFVFTAHYDHLGHFGKDYIFYGANDNASGTAFVMDLARHYSKPENQPDYSMVFLALSCEEIGLGGSFYFVKNSYIPISNIKTLINFDMVGTGEEGITLVCGNAFPDEFKKFEQINNQHQYLKKVLSRDASKNSDHYPFYEKGAQAFFIYGMGKSGRYHHNSDTLDNLSLGGYNGLFKLITDYINLYNRK